MMGKSAAAISATQVCVRVKLYKTYSICNLDVRCARGRGGGGTPANFG